MRKLNLIFGTIAVAAGVSACADNLNSGNTGQTPVELVSMSFGAVMDNEYDTDVKTTYLSKEIFWEQEDEITVISVADGLATPTTFTATTVSEDKTTAKFEGVAVANSSCYYAVYPSSESNAFDVETSELTVNLPSDQIAVVNGFASGSNVTVAYSPAGGEEVGEEYILGFKNVPALLAFRFETDEDAANTKSVTFRLKKNEMEYWGIAGNAVLKLDENNLPILQGEGSITEVTLNAPEGGFVCYDGTDVRKMYYIPVLPVGNITGMEIDFTDQEDNVWTRKNDSSCLMERNKLNFIGHVPNPYDTLPKDITISLDFLNSSNVNPLGTFIAWANQSTDGDTYQYVYDYEFNGQPMQLDLDFTIYCGKKYSYEAKLENFSKLLFVNTSGEWCIKFPAIRGRYLAEVSVNHTGTTYGRNFRLQEGYPTAGKYFTVNVAPPSTTGIGTATIRIPTGASGGANLKETEVSTSYYLQLTSQAVYYVTGITLTYTKDKPTAAE